MAVEEALVGARRSRKGDHGAVPGVRDDPLDAVLFCLFEGERFFFFLWKKKKSENLFSLSFSSPSRKKKRHKKLFLKLTQSTRVLSSFRSLYSFDLGSSFSQSS